MTSARSQKRREILLKNSFAFILGFAVVASVHATPPAFADVLIIKQWHLAPGTKTLDVEASKKLPQYTNQKAIYTKLIALAADKKLTLITEGCSGDISKNEHYGWNYKTLKQKKNESVFADILAFTPAKLKAQLDAKINVVCADNEDLMKKQLLAFSDLRAFVGYYSRLKEFKGKNEKSYALYEKALLDKEGKVGKVDAVAYAREKAVAAMDEVEKLIEERNQKFVAAAKEALAANPVIVVGGLHAKGIQAHFEKEKIKYTVFSPEGYKEADENLTESLRALLK